VSTVTVETHTREHHCTYGDSELRKLVAETLAANVNVRLNRPGVEFSVAFENDDQGMRAVVVIVEDLMPQAVDVDALR
jgi:hypothetical protein